MSVYNAMVRFFFCCCRAVWGVQLKRVGRGATTLTCTDTHTHTPTHTDTYTKRAREKKTKTHGKKEQACGKRPTPPLSSSRDFPHRFRPPRSVS